jgi:hypothetical protein
VTARNLEARNRDERNLDERNLDERNLRMRAAKEGETPLFTTVDHAALSLFIEHDADLAIRNQKGETVIEAAKDHGPDGEKALRKAILKWSR